MILVEIVVVNNDVFNEEVLVQTVPDLGISIGKPAC
jgi:hypothetical protein